MGRAKKLAVVALIGIGVWWVATQPEDAADRVRGGVDILQDGAESGRTFISEATE